MTQVTLLPGPWSVVEMHLQGAEGETTSREMLCHISHPWEQSPTKHVFGVLQLELLSILCSSPYPTPHMPNTAFRYPQLSVASAKTTVAISCTNTAAHKTHSCYQLSAWCEIQHSFYLPQRDL